MRDRNAMIQRMNELADTKSVHNSNTNPRTIGTLIDYKRSGDNVAYGIIKENHNYYIKKGGIRTNLNESDFVYIGGLENITNYQYKTFADADKNRNMLLNTINESLVYSQSKKKINENEIDDKISNTEEKMTDLEASTSNNADAEIAAGFDSEPMGDEPTGDEKSVNDMPPVGDDETPTTDGGPDTSDINIDDINLDGAEGGTEEAPVDDTDTEEMPVDDTANTGDYVDDPLKEIEKSIGKLANKVRKAEITPEQTKVFVNSFLASFKDKFPDVEIEDRKEMANRILKVVPDEDVESLSDTIPNDEVAESNNKFVQYAESMGYDSANALMEDEEGVTNLISGYANNEIEGEEGDNDDDLNTIAMIVKIVNPEILNKLKTDYGHDEYADKLQPFVDQMNESSEEDNIQKIDELFGGLKALGQKAKEVGQGAVNKAKDFGQNAVNKAKDFGQGVVDKGKEIGKEISQTYHSGEVAGEIKKLESLATSLGQQVQSLNTRLEKAGKSPINPTQIISVLSNQMRGSGNVNLKNSKIGANLSEIDDPVKTEVSDEDTLTSDNSNDSFIAPDSQSMGVGGLRNPAPTMVTIEGANGTSIDVELNEAVKQLKNIITEMKKTSTGLTNKEKSNIVKKTKKGEDIGKPGKDFEKVEKVAKKSGVSDPEKVAATAMWKNTAKNKNMNESEQKLRKYIRTRLNEIAGITKPILNENAKSDKLKKLDKMIDEQFENYKVKFKNKLK